LTEYAGILLRYSQTARFYDSTVLNTKETKEWSGRGNLKKDKDHYGTNGGQRDNTTISITSFP
jgi:hypothetical protein